MIPWELNDDATLVELGRQMIEDGLTILSKPMDAYQQGERDFLIELQKVWGHMSIRDAFDKADNVLRITTNGETVYQDRLLQGGADSPYFAGLISAKMECVGYFIGAAAGMEAYREHLETNVKPLVERDATK